MHGPSPGLAMSVKMEKLDDSSGVGRDRNGGNPDSPGGLDAQLWHACAGGMVQLPPVGAKVIYFPQGHGEQAATTPDFPRSLRPSGTIPCRVVSVQFLADAETDEVYARMRLQPEGASFAHDLMEESPSSPPFEKPASFAKTLTQSDANNGGGFSVPRYCAETIFPPLDYSIDPPVQTVLAKDVHGEVWKFRHIYRGTPRRHLLTTGWSTFVNQKKLVAGDAIVFLRSASGELCVGVRRSMRGASGGDSSSWHSSSTTSASARPSRWEVKGTESFSDFLGAGDSALGLSANAGVVRAGGPGPSATSSFARNRARVTAKSVLEAASLAVAGKPFEVLYYPRASTAEFCVKAAMVKQALDHIWHAGMRFKMAFETEDSSRISWFMGTISTVQPADPLLWPNSPWRVLQVTWDEPDLLQGVTRVSPWQVELVATLPMQLPPFSLPKKKLRASQPSELQLQAPGLLGMPIVLPNGLLGQLAPWGAPAHTDEASAGMQGARHDRIYGLTLSDFRPGNKHPLFSENFYHPEHVPPNRSIPTDTANFTSLYDRPAQRSNLSLGFVPSGGPQVENPSWANSPTPKSTSFLLFGQAIDPTSSTKSQQHYPAGNSSSDGPLLQDGQRASTTSNSSSDNTQPETLDKMQRYLSGLPNGGSKVGTDGAISRYHQGDSGLGSDPSTGSVIGSLKWFKELGLDREKAGERTSSDVFHCKVFRESDEVGRTLDLSHFATYEELFERLAAMFSIQQSHIQSCVVYKDTEGCTKRVGEEPFRSFVKWVKRLTILSDPGGSGMARSQP